MRFRAGERSKRERERMNRINEKIRLQSGEDADNSAKHAMHHLNAAQVHSS